MPSPLRRASPLSKQPLLRTPHGGAAVTATNTSSIGSSPRNHEQHQHHSIPRSSNNKYPYYSSPTPTKFFSSPSNKRGSSGGGGSGGGGGGNGSNLRPGTFYILLLCFMPLVFVWQWWIFWLNQNHILYQENLQPMSGSLSATSPSLLIKNQPRMNTQTTSTGSSRTSALLPTIKSERKHSSSTTDAYSSNSSLKDYDYSRYPILSKDLYQPHASNPLNVIFVDQTTVIKSAAAATTLLSSRNNQTRQSLLRQGLERSRYIHVITDGPDDQLNNIASSVSSPFLIVHLIDWASLKRDCHLLERYYYNYNNNNSRQYSTLFSNKDHHHQVLVYYDTSDSARVVICPHVNALFEYNNIRIVKQAIVVNRHWDPQRQWIVLGRISENNGTPTLPKDDKQIMTNHYPILHASVFLRESFVELLAKVLEKEQGSGGTTSLGGGNWTNTVSTMLAHRKRKLDLATHVRKGDYTRYSFLRRRVGQEVLHLGNKTNNPKKKNNNNNSNTSFTGSSSHQQEPRSLRILVRIMGDEKEMETNGGEPQAEYILSLLTTKIVIVAQHDEWEDHERLLQAMASGALVMTDVMLAPPHGIINGTNIVMYDSVSSLVRLVWHYLHPNQTKERLKIAQLGCQLAFEKHRSWHRLEQVLFGSTRSKAGQLSSSTSSTTTTTKQQRHT